jgi:hexokinase
MNVTWVMGYPTGEERGQYLTLDMGGTNLRVCEVTLAGRHEDFRVTQSKCKLPDDLNNSTPDELWDYVAECLRVFLRDHHPMDETTERFPLAWTFSYPVTQNSVKDGILQRWTKSISVPGVVGCDVVTQLQAALDRMVCLRSLSIGRYPQLIVRALANRYRSAGQ